MPQEVPCSESRTLSDTGCAGRSPGCSSGRTSCGAEMLWLLLFGWYLVVMMHQDAANAVVIV
jgi:hypothetical protein